MQATLSTVEYLSIAKMTVVYVCLQAYIYIYIYLYSPSWCNFFIELNLMFSSVEIKERWARVQISVLPCKNENYMGYEFIIIIIIFN
jgi:hypothetical protein